MKKISLFIFLLVFSLSSFSADTHNLKKLFISNFDQFYVERHCRQNIIRLIEEAKKLKINLDNSYVLKFEGLGFLETSGFYTRSSVNERHMLGYYHFVFVADNLVFDFDLYEPLVLPLEDYIRLQFTPKSLPYYIFGINYVPEIQLKNWKITAYNLKNPHLPANSIIWSKKLGEWIDLSSIMKKVRVR
jgi:hypothetical protein